MKSKIHENFPVWFQIVIFVLAVVTVYGHTLDVPFYFDDFSSISKNEAVHNLADLERLWSFSKLRVVAYFTFALNYHFHGLDVTGYHVVNILIHALSGIAVFALGRLLCRTPALKKLEEDSLFFVPFLAALFFVIHPLQTQAVTYIVQRVASLAGLFYILVLWCYVKSRTCEGKIHWPWVVSALLCTVLAFFTKQSTFTLPLAILLVEIIFFGGKFKRLNKVIPIITIVLCLVSIMLISYFGTVQLAFNALDSLTRETDMLSRDRYLATQSLVLWTYINLFFFPVGLNLDYHVTLPDGIFDPLVLLALSAHVFMVFSAFYFRKKNPFLSFGILFYYAAHLVESSIIPIRDIVFEHRTYLPNLGLCLATSFLVSQGIRRFRTTALLLTLCLIFFLGTATWMRNTIWRDPVALWKDSVEKAPGNPRPYISLAINYEEKGFNKEAIHYYQQALLLKPDYIPAHNNLGVLLSKEGDTQGAIAHFAEAIAIYPDHFKSHSNMGIALLNEGVLNKARFHLGKALELKPDCAITHNAMGLLQVRQGILEGSVYHFQEAIRLSSGWGSPHSYLAELYLQQGKVENAIKHYTKAIIFDPTDAELHGNLGFIYQMRNDFDNAARYYEEALKLDPDLTEVHNFLGITYFGLNKYDLALKHLQIVLAKIPDHQEALFYYQRAVSLIKPAS